MSEEDLDDSYELLSEVGLRDSATQTALTYTRRSASTASSSSQSTSQNIFRPSLTKATLRWGYLLQKYLKIRKLQLLFHNTGTFLQLISDTARNRVSKTYRLK